MRLLYSFTSVIICCAAVTSASTLTCLSCDSIPRPSACQYIERCGPDEVCSIESFVTGIGSIVFKLGCKDKTYCGSSRRSNDVQNKSSESFASTNTQICSECCSGDLCNAAGCGQTGYSSSLGPVCYSCDLQIGASMCNQIEQCGRDQICEIRPVYKLGSNEDWYKSQCKHTFECSAEHRPQCNACCNTTACNKYAPTHCGFTTPPTAPHSTLSTKRTAATTSTIPSLLQIGSTDMCTTVVKEEAHKYGGILAQHEQSCYQLIHGQLSWENAERTCVKYDGHLLHITKDPDQKFIESLLSHHYRQPVWIGLHDRDREEHFQWTSGDRVTYYRWVHNRTSDLTINAREDCVVFIPTLYGGAWDDIACNQYRPFICQYPTKDASVTQHPLTSIAATTESHVTRPSTMTLYGDTHSCPASVLHHVSSTAGVVYGHNSNCYVLVNLNTNWFHAEYLCQTQYSGHLADVSDSMEQGNIQLFFKRFIPHLNVWIGLNDIGRRGHFKWTSGAPANYHSNPIASPHNHDGCVYMMPYMNGQWSTSASCGHTTSTSDVNYPFLCKITTKDASITQHPLTSVAATTASHGSRVTRPSIMTLYGDTHSCPASVLHHVSGTEGAIYGYNSHCYVLAYDNTTWSNAEHLCQTQYSGHLADVHDSMDQYHIQLFLRHFIPHLDVWIGLNDIGRRGHYKWTSGAPANYKDWQSHTNPIASLHNHEGCVYMMPYMNGQWSTSASCGHTTSTSDVHYPFLCKIKAEVQIIG